MKSFLISCALTLLPAFSFGAWKEHPGAVQTVYQDHVPQTDPTGRRLAQFDPDHSFFPLALYHALQGQYTGIQDELKDDAAAGFNACMPFEHPSTPTTARSASNTASPKPLRLPPSR